MFNETTHGQNLFVLNQSLRWWWWSAVIVYVQQFAVLQIACGVKCHKVSQKRFTLSLSMTSNATIA